MKIKLRDITREQFEKWNRNNMCVDCDDCIFRNVYCNSDDCECWVYHKDMFSDKFLDQEIGIEDEPILTEEERQYLGAVIKPFRDKVAVISKQETPANIKTKEYICMFLTSNDGTSWEDFFALPYFEVGTMYKGMELEKKYTLEQLGL